MYARSIFVCQCERKYLPGHSYSKIVIVVQFNARVQRRMISVVNLFRIFESISVCFVAAICDPVHAVEAMHVLP